MALLVLTKARSQWQLYRDIKLKPHLISSSFFYCGANIWVVRNFTPPINCGVSPLEILFYIEVADAVVESGITREEANNLVLDWVKELDRKKAPPKKGITITDVYDLHKGEPTKEHKKKYESIKNELRKRNFPID